MNNTKPRYINFREFCGAMDAALPSTVPVTISARQSGRVFQRLMFATRAALIGSMMDPALKEQLIEETGVFDRVYEQLRQEIKMSVAAWIDYTEIGPKTLQAFIWRIHERVAAVMEHYVAAQPPVKKPVVIPQVEPDWDYTIAQFVTAPHSRNSSDGAGAPDC